MTAERWHRVQAVLREALDCAPAVRAQMLSERCGSDEALRREVETLLASDPEVGSFLDNPTVKAASDPMAGRLIGNYIITGELARGGMGTVYRARHVSLPREAVVKCIRPPLASSREHQEELRARFRQEAHLQSQLDHPHIVRVYEFFAGVEEHFLVMEYVPGSSLRTILDRRRLLPVSEATALAIQALDGLSHAHGFGIIHRDIKPANLLVDEQGNLKLTDFGIAKALSGGGLTQVGFSPGTAGYMSPEQVRGLPLDLRSDLYSLGVTLHEMLTGRVPFPRLNIGPDPPPIPKLNPDIPDALAEAVTRSLQREPDQRWQTAAEFRDHLVSCAIPQHERKKHLRGRIALAVGAALVSLLAAAFWLGRSEKPAALQPSIAVLPFLDMSPDKNQEYFSDGLAEELLNGLAKIPGLRVTGRTSSFQFKGKTGDFRVIGQTLHVATILEGSVRRQGNRARITVQLIKAADGFHLWSETYDREVNDIFVVQEEIARAVTGALKLKLLPGTPAATSAKSTNIKAYNYYLQAQYFYGRRNKPDLEKAADCFVQATTLDPAYAPAWAGLGRSRVAQADRGYVPEKQGYRQGQDAVQHALALDPDLAEAHATMGTILKDQYWDWLGADASYRRALALAPGNTTAVAGAGDLVWILGRLNEAVALYRRAIDIDPLDNNSYLNLGLILDSAGRHEEARVALAEALKLAPEMDGAHFALCRSYLAQLLPKQALAEAEKERHAVFRLLGLALAYYALGRRESDTNLAELVAKFAASDPYQIADAYAFRGETDKAFEWLERSYGARDPGLIEIKGDPLLNRLRLDPRYAALLKKMRLPV